MSDLPRTQQRTSDVNTLVDRILALRRPAPAHAILVGVSGIDGSGKSWLSDGLAARLESRGARVALIHADGWLNLPAIRFSNERPGRHFYEHALRLPEMFESLAIPLLANRSIRLEADYAEETAPSYRRHVWSYEDIDIVLVESVFLFKRAYRSLFDLAIWVESTFDTALERALARGQERLSRAETIRAYETIYFPAQRIHLERDEPKARADLLFVNDSRLGASLPATSRRPGHASPPPPMEKGNTLLRERGLIAWSVPETAMLRRRWEEANVRLPL